LQPRLISDALIGVENNQDYRDSCWLLYGGGVVLFGSCSNRETAWKKCKCEEQCPVSVPEETSDDISGQHQVMDQSPSGRVKDGQRLFGAQYT